MAIAQHPMSRTEIDPTPGQAQLVSREDASVNWVHHQRKWASLKLAMCGAMSAA